MVKKDTQKRYNARKVLYLQRKREHEAALEARRALYSVRREAGIGGISITPTGRKVARRGRIAPEVKPKVIKPEIKKKPPLVDVVDEDDYLRLDVELSEVPLPQDITIDEITDLSFRHGVLEIRFRKRKKKLTKEEKEELAKAEGEKITAEVKKKILLFLKKRAKEVRKLRL